ncbi:MAG TPA: hypothetical protein PLV87_17875, partial [Opitutaceae bacterium]|nr:hypothetical protein [Opitutaceae bacterium]
GQAQRNPQPVLLRLADNAALHAARILELAGEPARPYLAELRSRWTTAKSHWQKSYLEYYISMALGALIAHFDPTFAQY